MGATDALQVRGEEMCGNAALATKKVGGSQELPLPLWPGRAGGSDPALPPRRLAEMTYLKDTGMSQVLPAVD